MSLIWSRICHWTTSNNKHFYCVLKIELPKRILWNAPHTIFVFSGAAQRFACPQQAVGAKRAQPRPDENWGILSKISRNLTIFKLSCLYDTALGAILTVLASKLNRFAADWN